MFPQGNVQWFRSTSFAYKVVNGYTWSDWSDWEGSDVKIKFDLSNDIITIFSPQIQRYRIIDTLTPDYDSSGNQVKFQAVDSEDVLCHIRLRIEDSGNSQIYVDYSNLMFCYNVVRIK